MFVRNPQKSQQGLRQLVNPEIKSRPQTAPNLQNYLMELQPIQTKNSMNTLNQIYFGKQKTIKKPLTVQLQENQYKQEKNVLKQSEQIGLIEKTKYTQQQFVPQQFEQIDNEKEQIQQIFDIIRNNSDYDNLPYKPFEIDFDESPHFVQVNSPPQNHVQNLIMDDFGIDLPKIRRPIVQTRWYPGQDWIERKKVQYSRYYPLKNDRVQSAQVMRSKSQPTNRIQSAQVMRSNDYESITLTQQQFKFNSNQYKNLPFKPWDLTNSKNPNVTSEIAFDTAQYENLPFKPQQVKDEPLTQIKPRPQSSQVLKPNSDSQLNKSVPNLQFDPQIYQKLPFEPFSINSKLASTYNDFDVTQSVKLTSQSLTQNSNLVTQPQIQSKISSQETTQKQELNQSDLQIPISFQIENYQNLPFKPFQVQKTVSFQITAQSSLKETNDFDATMSVKLTDIKNSLKNSIKLDKENVNEQSQKQNTKETDKSQNNSNNNISYHVSNKVSNVQSSIQVQLSEIETMQCKPVVQKEAKLEYEATNYQNLPFKPYSVQ